MQLASTRTAAAPITPPELPNDPVDRALVEAGTELRRAGNIWRTESRHDGVPQLATIQASRAASLLDTASVIAVRADARTVQASTEASAVLGAALVEMNHRGDEDAVIDGRITTALANAAALVQDAREAHAEFVAAPR